MRHRFKKVQIFNLPGLSAGLKMGTDTVHSV